MKQRTFKLDVPEYEQIPEFMKILDDLSVGNNVFLVGPAGTGKSTLARLVVYSFMNRAVNDGKELPFVKINCNQWTSPTDIKGGQTIEGYREGGLIEAWRDGKILILDELPKLDPNTAGILNDALAESSIADAVIFNGLNQPIKKHPDFGCIATGNVIGKSVSGNYSGNNKQDASLIDRFSGNIYQVGFNTVLERRVIYPEVVEICIKIRDKILELEGGTNSMDPDELMTLRTMIHFNKIYELEMLRSTRLEDENGNTHPRNERGKRLRDSLESYFMAMSNDKAMVIKEDLQIIDFYRTYPASRQEFIAEYKKRHAA